VTLPAWTVVHQQGSAAAFHEQAVPEPPRHELWWFEVTRPAVVLGSTQRLEVVDGAAAAAAGTEVARRRSGGGAVHLRPGEATWIDVVLPATDPRWVADVGRSFAWLGAAWARVLEELGHPGATVHDGPLVRTRWSDLVCFAGLGPGEVLVGGRKAVGIAQRRTRTHARFQCAVLHLWEPGALLEVLQLSDGERADAARELAAAATGLGAVPGRDLVEHLRAAIS